jgi:signal transduction histidine kinase
VWNNIISNAVKLSCPDSTVAIRVAESEEEATPLSELPGKGLAYAIISA